MPTIDSPTPDTVAATGAQFPIERQRVTLAFGATSFPYTATRPHMGVDLSPWPGAYGQPIKSVFPGTVTFAGERGNYGKLIRVTSKLGYPVSAKNLYGQVVTIPAGQQFTLWYGHCEELWQRAGYVVPAGQNIAAIGSTGLAYGPHLHLECRFNNEFLDPMDLMVATEAVSDINRVVYA